MKFLFRLFLVTGLLLVATNASAFESTYFNFNNLSDAQDNIEIPIWIFGDGVTGEFEEMAYAASTTSIITGTDIVDSGNAQVNALLDFTMPNITTTETDSEGLTSTWDITFDWTNLTGTLDDGFGADVLRATYSSGTINFYLNEYNPFDGTLLDSEILAVVDVKSGGYTLDLDPTSATYLQGPYTIEGVMDVKIDEFWYLFGTDIDIASFSMGWVTADTQGDNNDVFIEDFGDYQVVTSSHNSSLRINVVPEPTTFALFGLGLLSLAGFARRKN